MTERPLEAEQPEGLRRALCRQISILRTVGLLLLTLLAVSVTLGLILAAANDESAVSAVRIVVGILAVTSVLVLAALVGSLSRAVLLLLEQSPQGNGKEGADSVSASESNEAEAD